MKDTVRTGPGTGERGWRRRRRRRKEEMEGEGNHNTWERGEYTVIAGTSIKFENIYFFPENFGISKFKIF